MFLADVGIRARLVIGNLAEANVRMALGCKRSRGPGHRGVSSDVGPKLKLHPHLIHSRDLERRPVRQSWPWYPTVADVISTKLILPLLPRWALTFVAPETTFVLFHWGIDYVVRGVRRVPPTRSLVVWS